MENFKTNRNVLIAVDVQNDFVDGSLAVNEAENIVEPINQVAQNVRSLHGQAVYTRDWHPAATPHFDTWPVHCVAGTDGAEFHPYLDINQNDIIISKGMGQSDGYSGWEGVAGDGTTLEQLVLPRSPRERVRVFIGGLATDYCVKATALDIASRVKDTDEVGVYLLEDAIRAVNLEADDGQKAVAMLGQAGLQLTTSREAIAMMGKIQ